LINININDLHIPSLSGYSQRIDFKKKKKKFLGNILAI